MRQRVILGLAAALAVLAPTSGSAQPAGDRIIVWRAADGGERRASVPADALTQFRADRQAAIEQARRAAARRIEAAMSESLRPILADGEARTTAFVDWVFDWWTAYLLLGQTAGRATGTAVMLRPDMSLRAAGQTLEARVAEAYRRLVLQPGATDRRLRGAALAVDRAAVEVLRVVCRDNVEEGRRFVAAHARHVEVRGESGAWRAINGADGTGHEVGEDCRQIVPAPDEFALAAAPPTAAAAFGPGPTGEFLSARLARPFITFSAGTALRLAFPVIGTAVVVGEVAVSSIAFGTGIDYVLNEADEAAHRDGVEREVNEMVRSAAGAYEAAAAARHRRAVEQSIARLSAALPRAP